MILALSAFLIGSASANQAPIEDNSFLLSEGYNQDPGVVQVIQGFQWAPSSQDWSHFAAIEVPIVTEKHQLTLQTSLLHAGTASTPVEFGDLMLNYQYWLISEGSVYLAPRVGFYLPTGSYQRSAGSGTLGVMTGISFTANFSEKLAHHWSADVVVYPLSRATDGSSATTLDATLATSIVWRPLWFFNLLTEVLLVSDQSPTPGSGSTRAWNGILNPGTRFLIRFGKKRPWEIVPGVSVPLVWSIAGGSVTLGVFGYLSVEGPWW